MNCEYYDDGRCTLNRFDGDECWLPCSVWNDTRAAIEDELEEEDTDTDWDGEAAAESHYRRTR